MVRARGDSYYLAYNVAQTFLSALSGWNRLWNRQVGIK
ncbi:unnamed protein product, partial [marine sediment metagenome]